MSDVTVQGHTFGRPVVVATHPRSGTHLTIDFLRRHFPACEADRWWWEPLNHLFLALDRLHPAHPHTMRRETALRILGRPRRPVVKTHAPASLQNFEDTPVSAFVRGLVGAAQVLYVVRDGRDVLCSAHRWTQAKGGGTMSIQEYLRKTDEHGRSRVQRWGEHVRRWTDRASWVVRFEALIQTPEQVLQRMAEVLDLTPSREQPLLPPREQTDSQLWDYWRRLTRQHEVTGVDGRFQGKDPLDWEEAFTPEDHQLFLDEAGDVLRRFGYVSETQTETQSALDE